MLSPEARAERIKVVKGYIATLRAAEGLTAKQREALMQAQFRELADLCEGRVTGVDNQPVQA